MNLPEKWIWLSSDIYPDFQNTNVSAMTGKSDCNYCVAEFKKVFDFNKKVKKLFMRFSGDTAFELYLNEEIIATGPVPVAGDFLGNEFPRGQHYSDEIEGEYQAYFAHYLLEAVHRCTHCHWL